MQGRQTQNQFVCLQLMDKPQKGFHQSLGQAFSKACGFLRQSLKSPSADGEISNRSNFLKKYRKDVRHPKGGFAVSKTTESLSLTTDNEIPQKVISSLFLKGCRHFVCSLKADKRKISLSAFLSNAAVDGGFGVSDKLFAVTAVLA